MLALLALLLGATAVTILVQAAVAPRGHADARIRDIDAYGYSALTSEPAGRQSISARPVAQRLGDAIGDRFGTTGDSKLRRELLAAGMYKMTPRVLVGYQALAAVGGIFYGVLLDLHPSISGPFIDSALLAAIAWVLPSTYVRRVGRMRLDNIDRGLPDVIDLIVVSVEAGQGFAQAMNTAADRTKGPLGEELRLTLQEQRFGLQMDRALENLNGRADTPNMRTFVRSVVQGERLGVSIGQIMRNVSHEMRLRRRQAAEEAAQKTTVKILFPLVFFILPALFIVVLAPALLGLGDAI